MNSFLEYCQVHIEAAKKHPIFVDLPNEAKFTLVSNPDLVLIKKNRYCASKPDGSLMNIHTLMQVNSIWKNMKKPLGTILPTAESLASNDKFYLDNQQKMKQAASRLGLVKGSFVGGEQRYNETANEYTLISSRTFEPLTFELRADGYWYSKKR